MNTLSFLEKKSNKDVEYIRSFLYKNYIKTHIEDVDSDKKRMIFMSNKSQSDFNNPITNECNGLIMEYGINKFKALVIPILKLNNNYKKKEVKKFYNDGLYTLHKIIDGTNVNLYYYNDSWRISTANGYDVTDLVFVNGKTYGYILQELLTENVEFSFDKLVKHKCYSLIFTYTDYHIFKNNKNSVTLIQSVDLNDFNDKKIMSISYTDQIGIPIMESITLERNIDNLMNNVYHAYNNYVKHDTIDFGYILRSKKPQVTKGSSHILMESSLMSSIRKSIYNNRTYSALIQSDELKEYGMTYNALKLHALESYLSINQISKFTKLFPMFNNDVKQFINIIRYVLPEYIYINRETLLVNIVNIQQVLNDELKLSLFQIVDKPIKDVNKLNKLALLLFIEINNANISFDAFEIKCIISDFITNVKFINYYNLYFFN